MMKVKPMIRIIDLGDQAVNNYLITGENGHILIDTGYQSGFRRFLRKLRKAGIDPEDILKKYRPFLDRIRLYPLKHK